MGFRAVAWWTLVVFPQLGHLKDLLALVWTMA